MVIVVVVGVVCDQIYRVYIIMIDTNNNTIDDGGDINDYCELPYLSSLQIGQLAVMINFTSVYSLQT